MKHKTASAMAIVVALIAADSLLAHHSFAALFDGEKMVRVKGVVQRFEWVNPHTYIIVDVRGADGKTEQWALEGPAPNGLQRRGYYTTSVKPGEPIEACGYGTRDGKPRTDQNGVTRWPMSVELLSLQGGEPIVWQDYGQRKCRDTQ